MLSSDDDRVPLGSIRRRSHLDSVMKVKVGTQLEDEVYRELKVTAARENRPISDLLQAIVSDYLNKTKHRTGHHSGLRRLLDSPAFKLTDEQFRETMEADFYDQ